MEYCKLEMKLKELTGLREKVILKKCVCYFSTMDRVSWIDQYIAQATDILILNHGLRRTFAEK